MAEKELTVQESLHHSSLFDTYKLPNPDVPQENMAGIRPIDFYIKRSEYLPKETAQMLAESASEFNMQQAETVDRGESPYVDILVLPELAHLQQESYQRNGARARALIRTHLSKDAAMAEVYPAMGGICIADQRLRQYDDLDGTGIHALLIDGNIGTATGHGIKLRGRLHSEILHAPRVVFRDDVVDSATTVLTLGQERLAYQGTEHRDVLSEVASLRAKGLAFDAAPLEAVFRHHAPHLLRTAGIVLDPLYWKNEPLFEGLQELCQTAGNDPWCQEQQMILERSHAYEAVRDDSELFKQGKVSSIRFPENWWIGGGAIQNIGSNGEAPTTIGMLDIGTPIHANDPETGEAFGFAKYLSGEKREQLLEQCTDPAEVIVRLCDRSRSLTRVKSEEGAAEEIVRDFSKYLETKI